MPDSRAGSKACFGHIKVFLHRRREPLGLPASGIRSTTPESTLAQAPHTIANKARQRRGLWGKFREDSPAPFSLVFRPLADSQSPVWARGSDRSIEQRTPLGPQPEPRGTAPDLRPAEGRTITGETLLTRLPSSFQTQQTPLRSFPRFPLPR